MSSPPSSGPAATSRATRVSVPGRRQLVGAVAMVSLGSFMVWVDTPVGAILGHQGPGLWTFYAAMFGLAGAIVPMRRLALFQGAVLAVVAVGLPVWQASRVVGLVGFGGWMPGPGLVLVIGGGVLAAVATARMARAPWPVVSRRPGPR